jgi:hypothetical protein
VLTVYNNDDKVKGSAKMGTKMNAGGICYLTSSTTECTKNFVYLVQGAESVVCVSVSKLLAQAKSHAIYDVLS